MTRAAASAVAYEKLVIGKNGREYDISGADPYGAKTTSFDYYESLLSPNITATMTLMDVGGSASYNTDYTTQERVGSLYNALPISGQEEIKFKIGELDFSNTPLYVNGAVNLGQESNREAIALSLVSKSAISNQESTVFRKYNNNIGNSVKSLINEYLKIPQNKIRIDPTKNSYSFIGNSNSVFEVICSLASKSVPESGDPGYFFYETKDGFNFRSIDKLISQQPINNTPYFRTDKLESGVETNQNDYKISRFSINKNQDLINALKSGVYYTRNIFWDPRTFTYEEIIYKLEDNKITSLGKSPIVPDVNSFCRTLYRIKDIGTLNSEVTGDVNNDPKEWQAKSAMRYNLLFTQVISIQVPCNTKLKAGDVIKCDFEIVTQGQKQVGTSDPVQSGNYLIVNLCHHFDPLRSFTSMTVVRDTYGLYTGKK